MHKYAQKKITLVAPACRHVSRAAAVVASTFRERFNLDTTDSDPGSGPRVLFRWNSLNTNFRSAAVYLGSPLQYNERTLTNISRTCSCFVVPNRQDAERVRKLVTVPVFEVQPGVPEEFNLLGRTPNLGRLRVGFVAPFKSSLPGYPDPKGLREIRALANEGKYRWKILDPQNAIEYEQMPDWYRSIDVLVNLSVGEGVPHAVLEALACGCAVIAPEVGVIPELDAGPALIVLKERSVEAIKQALKSISDNRHTLIPSIRESAARLINNGWRWPRRVNAWLPVLQLMNQDAEKSLVTQVQGLVTHADLRDRQSIADYTSGFLGLNNWSKGDTPLFSVLMPLYNKRPYLATAVESVFAQTYPHWELVIVDDGSTDGSGEEAEELARKDKRIRVIHQENLGCASATNRAVAESLGVICGVLDADDALHPEALSKMVEGYRRNPWCGFGWSQFAYCDVETLKTVMRGYARALKPGKTLLNTDCATAFRTFTLFAFEAFGWLAKMSNGANDKDLFLKLEEVTPGFYVDDVLYYARQTLKQRCPGSITDLAGKRSKFNHEEVRSMAKTRRLSACALSIIVPHMGRPEHLRAVLREFRRQTSGNCELLVIDNHSPHSAEIEAITESNGFVYIPVNFGPHSAALSRNEGIKWASGRMILFNDSSCLPSPGLIDLCLSADEQTITLFDLHYQEKDGTRLDTHWRTSEFQKALTGEHRDLWRMVMGAGTLISRWNAQRTLFNSGFVGAWGCDDTFFGLQAYASGIPINVSDKGYVTRLWHESTKTVSPASNRSKYETLRDYYLKVMA